MMMMIIIMIIIIIIWNVKAKVIPVIIGATGNISESFGQNLSNMPGKHEMKELTPPPPPTHIGHCTYDCGKC